MLIKDQNEVILTLNTLNNFCTISWAKKKSSAPLVVKELFAPFSYGHAIASFTSNETRGIFSS